MSTEGVGGARYAALQAALECAALDPAAWTKVCDSLAALVDATGALLIPYDASVRGTALPHSPSLDEALQRMVETGWSDNDFRSRGFPKSMSTGFVTDQDLIAPEDMKRHPYYADFLAPANLKWFAGISIEVDGRIWGAAVHGTPSRGPFQSGEISKLLHVRDDICLAGRRAAALGGERVASLETTFAASGRGVAALGWSGKLVWLNTTAEAMLRDAELIANGRIRSRDPVVDGQLAEIIGRAVGFERHARIVLPGPVAVAAGDGRRFSFDVIPMPRDFQAMASGAAALVTMHEIAPVKGSDWRSMARLYGLTGREIDICAHLMSGRKLGTAALMMRISVSTARQHVKSAFAKTDTHGQAELVALLGRMGG